MWGESQPGTSAGSGGQGYCGFCRVLYRNLDEVHTSFIYRHNWVMWPGSSIHTQLYVSSTCLVSETRTLLEFPPEAPPPLAVSAAAGRHCWSVSCRTSCCTTHTATVTPGEQSKQLVPHLRPLITTVGYHSMTLLYYNIYWSHVVSCYVATLQLPYHYFSGCLLYQDIWVQSRSLMEPLM